MKKTALIALGVLCIVLSSCVTTPEVSRVSASEQIDISGYWNDTDVRVVCDALIEDCISSPRIDRYIREHENLPVFIVGTFKNDSTEHIDTSIIVKKMQTAIINSGKADFVADRGSREEVRAERDDQNLGNASDETAKALGNETGADFLLQGSVKAIVQKSENKTVRTYHISAELINIETNRIMWSGFNDSIKKVISSKNVRF
ncbi:MAG: penicillin-binding protein activator LpoB [Treponema sp.]